MALAAANDIAEHIFWGNGERAGPGGFHSIGQLANHQQRTPRPRIQRRFHQNNRTGFYTAEWSYGGQGDGTKVSSMFPDWMTDQQVLAAATEALAYWNQARVNVEETVRFDRFKRKYGIGWVGHAQVRAPAWTKSLLFVIGGMVTANQASSAFPLFGANANTAAAP